MDKGGRITLVCRLLHKIFKGSPIGVGIHHDPNVNVESNFGLHLIYTV